MVATSTTERYTETGPIVFGQGPVNIRWNKLSFHLSIDIDKHSIVIPPELAPMVIVALAHQHSRGKLLEFLQATFQHTIHLPHRFYRCGKLMLYKPVWQEV